MTSRRRIVMATCRQWPEISASDAALRLELERRGHDVVGRAWNDAPLIDFTSADMVVLRSNWDFHHHIDAFDEWLGAIERAGGVLHNSADLVRQHNHKSYLHRFADLGIRTPATLTLEAFDSDRIRAWMGARGLDQIVIKPAWGASGHDVERIVAADLEQAEQRWGHGADPRGLVVQEFVPQISEGEFALVYFDGRFSHALHRQPVADDFRVNSQYGGTMALASEVDPSAEALASRVLATLSEVPVYARIDVVGAGDQVTLMEVEVNEPALGLDLAPGSAARFAEALLGR